MDNIEHIGRRIKSIREKYKLSQAAFAKRIGVSPGNVGDWESSNKKSVPGGRSILAISEEFNVSADWLLKGEAIIDNYVEYKYTGLIYSNIKEILDKRGLSLYELTDIEEKTKIAPETIAMWGFGKGKPSNISLTNLANYLYVPLNWIVEGYSTPEDLKMGFEEMDAVFGDSEHLKSVNEQYVEGDTLDLVSEEDKAAKYEAKERSAILNTTTGNGKISSHISKLYTQLSDRDKREVVEIINLKLRLSRECEE